MSSEAERQRLIPKGDDRTSSTAAGNNASTSSSTCCKFGVPVIVLAIVGALVYVLFTVILPMHGQDINVPPSPAYSLVTTLQSGDRLQLYSSSYGKFLNLRSLTIDEVEPDAGTDKDADETVEDADTDTDTDVDADVDADDNTGNDKHSSKKNKDTGTDTSTSKHKHNKKSKMNLRSAGPEEDSTQLILGDAVPFLFGSTFEVVGSTGDCFQLRAMNRKFLSLDKQSGAVTASSDGSGSSSFFSLAMIADADPELVGTYNHHNPMDKVISGVQLKMCGKEHWLEVANLDTTADDTPTLGQVQQLRYSVDWFWSHAVEKPAALGSSKSYLHVVQVAEIKGVNLGGWFIPEVWMVPDFQNGSGLGWAGSLCGVVEYNRTFAAEKMDYMLKHWITEKDFAEIAVLGFNSIRLPVGYWNIIPDPYHKYVPEDVSVSLGYIDWAFDMAEKYGLTVLLDLHGAPGSQNGIDHSGCNTEPMWHKKKNVELSLDTIQTMVDRYGDRRSLIGIELLNEPARGYTENYHDLLVDFYQASYNIIRKKSKTCLVVFNDIYDQTYASWNTVLTEPTYTNVVFDWHLYDWQEPFTSESNAEHVFDAEKWSKLITEYSIFHPMMVAEWSMSTGIVTQAGQPFVDACVSSFHKSFGSYAWNWKIEKGIHFDEWNVQLQYSKKNGLRPFSVSDESMEKFLEYYNSK